MPASPEVSPLPWTAARAIGAALQALLLGVLLFAGIARIVTLESGARVFQYQAW